jgi:glycosyltransferase involved in cell wall biosynthesis
VRVILEALGIGCPGGTRSASLNLVEGLLALDTGDDYVLLSSQHERLSGDGPVQQFVLPPMGRMLDRLRLQLFLPRLVTRYGASLVHHTKHLCTFFLPCPHVVTIHDVTMLRYPALFSRADVLYYRAVEPHSLAGAARIIASSEATAADLRRFYGLPASKIEVIHLGYDAIFDAPARGTGRLTARRFGVKGDYLLHVGSISRKKNLLTLVRAFDLLRRQRGYDGSLLLVGREYYQGKERRLGAVLEELGLTDKVVLTGAVGQEDLRELYATAELFAFPSLHEGFGLVPLEAMACGVPVVAAGSSAVREVVGDAGILVEPGEDYVVLAEAMWQALQPGEKSRLSSAGLARARLFSRATAASRTSTLYHQVTGP